MEVIKWANGEGQKLVLTREEATDLRKVIELALIYGVCNEGNFFEVEIREAQNETRR